MFFFSILCIINNLYIVQCKNIVLHFEKITIETFKEDKTINDLISYNIFTTLEVGVEPQLVAFLIDQNEASFYMRERLLSFNSTKSNEVKKLYYNMSNFWFDKHKSQEIKKCNFYQFCTEFFYFNTTNNTRVEASNFRFNIYFDFLIEKYKCGIIGFKNPTNIYYEDDQIHIYFFDELKSHNLIEENYFTILYNEKNDIFNYNENLYLGKIIIGESPHIFNSEEFFQNEQIFIPGNDYIFLVNELKFNSSTGWYSETDVEVQISFTSGFIKGTDLYRKEIEKFFFEELIIEELCKVEYVNENVYTSDYYIYSCNNNKKILDKIKHFPPLYLEVKTQNLTFIFTFKELFNEFKNRIYFLIAFRDDTYYTESSKWRVGDIFLRKYITSFNYDSKSIIFYRSQVDKANVNSEIIYEEKEVENKSNLFNIFRTLLEIFMAVFIILMLYIFYKTLRRKRKLHANELEDNNFAYEPKKETKLILIDKD